MKSKNIYEAVLKLIKIKIINNKINKRKIIKDKNHTTLYFSAINSLIDNKIMQLEQLESIILNSGGVFKSANYVVMNNSKLRVNIDFYSVIYANGKPLNKKRLSLQNFNLTDVDLIIFKELMLEASKDLIEYEEAA